MTLIIITGEIDLSVESMIGLSGALLGWLWAAGVPLEVAIPIVLVVGILGGLLNGLLVSRGGLPSLVVTLGTLALFRGLADVVLGPTAISNFPAAFTAFGFGNIPGTPIPWHAGGVRDPGRRLLDRGPRDMDRPPDLRGRQEQGRGALLRRARRHSEDGPLRRVRARGRVRRRDPDLALLQRPADNGTGLTLVVVTIVLLGGVDINGGKGTIPGVILAVFTLAVLQNALRLAGVSSEYQAVAVGLLLIVSVTVPYLARQTRSHGRSSSHRPAPAGRLGRPWRGRVVEAAEEEVSWCITLTDWPWLWPSLALVAGACSSAATAVPATPAPATPVPATAAPRRRRHPPRWRPPRWHPPRWRPPRRPHRPPPSPWSIIPKQINNPYFDVAYKGVPEGGHRSRRHRSARSARAPRMATQQVPFIQTATTQSVSAIMVSADDATADRARPSRPPWPPASRSSGYDSSPAVGAYNVFVNQADTAASARASPTWRATRRRTAPARSRSSPLPQTATNQNAWIDRHEDDPQAAPSTRASCSTASSTATTTRRSAPTQAQGLLPGAPEPQGHRRPDHRRHRRRGAGRRRPPARPGRSS